MQAAYVSITIVTATVILLAGVLLITELRFARAMNADSLHGGPLAEAIAAAASRLRGGVWLARYLRTRRIRFVARSLALAPARHIEAATLRLFRGAADLELQDRWRRWHRVHIPAFAFRVAAPNRSRQERLLRAMFAGFRQAIAGYDGRVPSERREHERRAAAITFDSLWPFVETVEELAVHCRLDLHALFAAEMTRTAMAIDDETLHVVCAWAVNELLERTPNERALGCTIARDLMQNGPPASAEGLRIVRDLYERVVHDRQSRKPKEREAAFFAVLDSVNMDWTAVRSEARTWKEERKRVLHTEADAAFGAFEKALGKSFDSVDSAPERSSARACAAVLLECSHELLAEATKLSALAGVRALAALRFVFRRSCTAAATSSRRAFPPETADERTSKRAREWYAEFIEHLCALFMFRVREPSVSAFLTIEAMEPIRDRASAEVATAMAQFVGNIAGKLDAGIAVCICEGVEEAVVDPRSMHVSEDFYFVYRDGRWTNAERETTAACPPSPIARFWPECAKRLNAHGTPDVAHWMNLRLELRDV